MGVAFADAWPRSMRKTMSRVSSRERDAWREVLAWSRASWERAYDLEPEEPRERAAAALVASLAE